MSCFLRSSTRLKYLSFTPRIISPIYFSVMEVRISNNMNSTDIVFFSFQTIFLLAHILRMLQVFGCVIVSRKSSTGVVTVPWRCKVTCENSSVPQHAYFGDFFWRIPFSSLCVLRSDPMPRIILFVFSAVCIFCSFISVLVVIGEFLKAFQPSFRFEWFRPVRNDWFEMRSRLCQCRSCSFNLFKIPVFAQFLVL